MSSTRNWPIKPLSLDEFSIVKIIYLALLAYLVFLTGMEHFSKSAVYGENTIATTLKLIFPFVLIAWIAQVFSRIRKKNRSLTSENQFLSKAQHQDRKMAMLGEIGQLIHACQSFDEVYTVASERFGHACPNTSGVLYLMSDAGDALEKVMQWGDVDPHEESFAPNECWALRCGRAHHVNGRADTVACQHVAADEADWHICLPLTAQTGAVGVLTVRGQRQASHTGDAGDWNEDDQIPFYTKVAEILALATANLRVRETLLGQAIRDPLTQLFNRRYFLETFPRELNRVARSNELLSLAILDIDHFKRFNDTYGHDAGDAVLRAVASVLKDQTRLADIACRYGGEEFVLVFPGMGPEDMVRRIQAVREQIEALKIVHAGQPLETVTISAGIAVYPHDAADMDALITVADQALYQSKAAGRNRATLSPVSQGMTAHAPDDLADYESDAVTAQSSLLRIADHHRSKAIN